MAEVSPHGTTPPTMPSVSTPVDTSDCPWPDRVQKALPGLTARSQLALAQFARTGYWPELAHALDLAEKDRKFRLL